MEESMPRNEWWKEAVIYQIYPRSFSDSNSDGIGDLQGIRHKIPYLSDLGVNALWLSPINVSPMFDFGYDISDYRAIDPVFGTLKDFDALINDAHKKKIKVMLDLVVNHTSHLHPWFAESRLSEKNPKRDWYIWRKGEKGKLPNNWKSVFGGPAWEWDEATASWYLHMFLKEQPDLNWRNPDVKKAVFADIEFWLKKGVDGFRLDVVNQYFKDDGLRNNPFRAWGWQYPRPFELQHHIFDRSRPEMHPLLKDLRKLLDRYDAASVGEIFCDYPGDPVLASSYLGMNDELHLAFDFSIIAQKWSGRNFAKTMRTWMHQCDAFNWPCIVLNNHDQPRSYTRHQKPGESDARAKILAALLLTMKGTPFIYYGEEIGMKNGDIRRDQLQDPVGVKYWPFNKGRDPERTPMLWDGSKYAGFSSAKPWLPVNNDAASRSLKIQEKDRSSIYSWYKDLLALRKKTPALRSGSWKEIVSGNDDLFVYTRQEGKKTVTVLLNFSNTQQHAGNTAEGKTLLSTERKTGSSIKGGIILQPYEALIIG
jgi:alpha-glucosidase